ncbi:response regulator [Ochrobactrum sp. AN78]|uniref:response regulator n=1 Tax=Ochrobactrum sp. AN78 TaxID=3039853 RepID=UPI002989DC89|nr:response regulator [Ochrobactrum sp. AN78]MDH7791618.1 CheY-like chemotaxis protein [Ochrobactrum sp. AN78]
MVDVSNGCGGNELSPQETVKQRSERKLLHLQSVKILVVEDEAIIRIEIIDELEFAGFAVVGTASADEAISILETQPEIQLVFTDIDMPGTMNGLILAAHVHRQWSSTKIIVTSGRDLVEPDCLPPGAQFLPKPYNVNYAIKQIQSLLRAK